jgi:hypothetical protein
MKKNFTHFILLCVVGIGFASCGIKGSGNTIRVERTVPDFNSVRAEGSYAVFIRQDSIFKVEVESDDNIVPFIETEVSNNTLIIKNKRRKILKQVSMQNIYISAPAYKRIDLWGSGNITCTNAIEGESLLLEIRGSGNLSIGGVMDKIRADISGSGYINALQLISSSAEVHISGSGNLDLNVLNKLDAYITGSGKVSYMGNPSVNKSVTGSGTVNQY